MTTTSTSAGTTPIPTFQQHKLPSLIDYLIERKQSQSACYEPSNSRSINVSYNSNDGKNGSIHNPTHIVIGNEAGDADSIISTIAYAYTQDCVMGEEPQPPPRLLPIISISDIDLQTQRPETVFLLQLVGIIPREHLVFVNTMFPDHWKTNGTRNSTSEIDVTLVDHNRFNHELFQKYNIQNGGRSTIQCNVVNIVDHHIDEGYHMDTCSNSSSPTTICCRNIAYDANTKVALVASTCTLLVEMLQHYFQNTKNGALGPLPLPASVSLLLLGVILLDSINMNVKAGKGTTRDSDAIQYLLQYTDWDNEGQSKNCLPTETIQLLFRNRDDTESTTKATQPDTNLLFETLQNAKFALEFWQSLSIRDALRLDYKMFSTNTISTTNNNGTAALYSFGISTVLMPFHDFTMKPDFVVSVVRDFINDMGISFLCIMLASTNRSPSLRNDNGTNTINNDLNREIVFIGPNAPFIDEMLDYLRESDGTLQLVELAPTAVTTFNDTPTQDTGTILYIRAFQQNNNAASRKQVAPLLMKYLTTTNATK